MQLHAGCTKPAVVAHSGESDRIITILDADEGGMNLPLAAIACCPSI